LPRGVEPPEVWAVVVALSPDGSHAAAVTMEGTVFVWDLATGAELLSVSVCNNGIAIDPTTGNVFVVRPSAVIGLLTDVTVNSKQTTASSSAFAGVDFSVTIPSAPSGSTALPTPNFPVTYDSRFIQISTNLFQGLAANCMASAGGYFITFNESTVSAHSLDWILGPLTSVNYGVTASCKSSLADSGIASSMTCVGPVNLTIQQNKIFNPSLKASSSISF